MVGRFSPEFVETRRRALEKFLGRIGVHPLLRQSDNFRSFLEANEVGLTTVKESAKAASKGKGGVMQWFSDATYSVSALLPLNTALPSNSNPPVFLLRLPKASAARLSVPRLLMILLLMRCVVRCVWRRV
jgi:hypothetical protein